MSNKRDYIDPSISSDEEGEESQVKMPKVHIKQQTTSSSSSNSSGSKHRARSPSPPNEESSSSNEKPSKRTKTEEIEEQASNDPYEQQMLQLDDDSGDIDWDEEDWKSHPPPAAPQDPAAPTTTSKLSSSSSSSNPTAKHTLLWATDVTPVADSPPNSNFILNLTKTPLKRVTGIYVPNNIGGVEGTLTNLDSNTVVNISVLLEPNIVIDFTDATDMEKVVKWSTKDWTDAGFRSAGAGCRSPGGGFWANLGKSQQAAVSTHESHCLNTTSAVSFIRALLAARLITHPQAEKLSKYSKTTQDKWASLIRPKVISCACNNCNHGGKITTATDAFSFDLAPWGRHHITTALVQLREAGQLHKVSGRKVREELGGLVAAPRRRAAAPCPPSISPSNRSPSSPPPPLSLHAGHRRLHGPGGGQHPGRPQGREHRQAVDAGPPRRHQDLPHEGQ